MHELYTGVYSKAKAVPNLNKKKVVLRQKLTSTIFIQSDISIYSFFSISPVFLRNLRRNLKNIFKENKRLFNQITI